MQKWKCLAMGSVFSVGLLSQGARADHIAFDNSGIGALQNYGNNLGLDFNVTTQITVTQLGAFDNGVVANLDGVVGGGIDVGIFDRTTQTIVGSVVHFSGSAPGTQLNGDAFLPTGILLPTGFHGSIVAFNDGNYNSNGGANATSTEDTGGGALTFVGGGRYGNASSIAYPGNADGGPTNRYDAGTFQFIVPEPSSACLIVLASGALLTRSRRVVVLGDSGRRE